MPIMRLIVCLTMVDANPKGLILFDCDGTLSHSHEAIIAAMQDAFADHTTFIPEGSAIAALIGRSLQHVVGQLLPPESATQASLVLAICEAYRHHYHRYESQVALFPGVSDGLQTLVDAGYWLGIVTGKSRAGLDRLMNRFDMQRHFLCIRTADVCASKPHPDMVESSLAETGMSAAQTWVVGDSRFDMQMAVNAGVRAVGVSYSHDSVATLQQAGALHIADSFPSVIDYFIPVSAPA